MSTICAISTAPGVGGIAVIRVSGPDTFKICDRIFRPKKAGKSLSTQKAYTLTYGSIVGNNDETIDEVIAAVFRAPHSFTGEDTVEITCHGSTYIQQQILQSLISSGCRIAQPGEYTQRAFMNGKMDLSQAEAVADLIASTSAGQHRLALSQMRGGFSRELAELRNQLLHFTSLMELELDFSDHEELEFADRSELRTLADHIEQVISKLAQSFSVGNAIKNGIPVAIIGETNAGKSTLLNALLNEDKAIVSDIHGTTRDVIEDTININGQLFRFIDTAGIRETSDAIEALGIERSFKALDQAQIVILMYDLTRDLKDFEAFYQEIAPRLTNKSVILAMNKCDVLPTSSLPTFSFPTEGWHQIAISAKSKLHIAELQQLLTEVSSIPTNPYVSLQSAQVQQLLTEVSSIPTLHQSDIIVTNVRHFEALTHALEAIHRVQEGLNSSLSGDFISQDLRECIFHLSDIVGEVTTDQVLGNIFRHFCIGK